MNAIQMKMAIDNLIDRVKSPRFFDGQYYDAINQAIQVILDGRTESIKKPVTYSFQSSQMLRNQLQSLIAPPIIVNNPPTNFIPLPADYYYLTLIQSTVKDNFYLTQEKNATRPITYGEEGILDRNPFKKPEIDKTYFNEVAGGWDILLPPNSTYIQYILDYLRKPVQVGIGNAGDKITTGGALVIGTDYYVYPDENTAGAVSGGITYYDGTLFTAANVLLTSGTVIPASAVVNCDMPTVLHDEINRLGAAILSGVLENYLKEQNLKAQNNES